MDRQRRPRRNADRARHPIPHRQHHQTDHGALVLDAVQRGELSLDDHVDDLVPDLLTGDRSVTVRMLLDHTTGIYDETNNLDILDDIALLTDPAQIAEADRLVDRYVAGDDIIVPDRLLVAAAEAHGRDFPAGTDFRYSNLNYQVVGIVLETVTGQPSPNCCTSGSSNRSASNTPRSRRPISAHPSSTATGPTSTTARSSTSPMSSRCSATVPTAA